MLCLAVLAARVMTPPCGEMYVWRVTPDLSVGVEARLLLLPLHWIQALCVLYFDILID